jgi:hypothetical protein
MKGKTKTLTEQVRKALLALPDPVLMKTLAEWLDGADEHIQYLDLTDEYRYVLRYRVQSDETETIYASFDELAEAEPDACASWIVPNIETVRAILGNSSTEQFYHTIIDLAGNGLHDLASEKSWGYPPSVISDSYDFMRCLTVHLHYKAFPEPELGRIFFPKPAARKRKPLHPSHSKIPNWHLCPPRDPESPAPLETHIATDIIKHE